MIEFAMVSYGLMMGFVLSCLQQNARRKMKSPPIMILTGYFLMGLSATIAAVLTGMIISRLI